MISLEKMRAMWNDNYNSIGENNFVEIGKIVEKKIKGIFVELKSEW